MREDLRYIESLMVDKNYSSHPSSEKLADFIDNRLIGKSKDEVIEHLIHCYECREIVNNILEYKKKSKPINKIVIATPIIALVASLVLFIYLPQDIEIGKIDLSKEYIEFRDVEHKKVNKVIDGDKILSKIISSTDMNHIVKFKEAQNEKEFDIALDIYQEAINAILEENISDKKRLKEIIVIHYSILKRAKKEGNSKVVENYKKLLIEELKEYYLKTIRSHYRRE